MLTAGSLVHVIYVLRASREFAVKGIDYRLIKMWGPEVAIIVEPGRQRSIAFGRFESQADYLFRRFNDAQPWPYVVIDDFLEPKVAREAAAAFPQIGSKNALLARTLGARKHEGALHDVDPIVAEIFDELLGERFVTFLEHVTGVRGLQPDFDLEGAGIHQGGAGSYLRVHADHNTHPTDASRFRRVNVMLYLNTTWREMWNGSLELWDREATSCHTSISPIFNRCVIMSVDDSTYHGYGPLRVPRGATRNALAAYYYTSDPAPRQTLSPHFTLWPRIRGERALQAMFHRLRMFVLSRVRS